VRLSGFCLDLTPLCDFFLTSCLLLSVHSPENQFNLRSIQMTPIINAFSPTARVGPARDAALMEAAQNLETVFLAEMLQSAGLGQTSEVFGGGAGEDQFASFLLQEQAKQIVQSGGIGLAQSLYEALKEQTHDV
jgi:Rod binding domain-containing protein